MRSCDICGSSSFTVYVFDDLDVCSECLAELKAHKRGGQRRPNESLAATGARVLYGGLKKALTKGGK